MAAGVEEDGAAGSDFGRALAGEASRARGEKDEVRRNTANSKMSPWATGASASVRDDRLERRRPSCSSGGARITRLGGSLRELIDEGGRGKQ